MFPMEAEAATGVVPKKLPWAVAACTKPGPLFFASSVTWKRCCGVSVSGCEDFKLTFDGFGKTFPASTTATSLPTPWPLAPLLYTGVAFTDSTAKAAVLPE